ncbi:hypothetical protein IEO70_17945 [Bacillus sp. AGMB 02131]|uniref:Uncharacterized protein n=1 Tax=Peribacillus faecalis TaxID=2772559 RepID=A0A927D348_9BACI|nr:hypothetical protein [Peribacillus faecalis]MBD3110219.1 hypothetical protein [Peribacillus faecalis]
MRERLLFCLLFIGIMLYYAIPRFSFSDSLEQAIFFASWLIFAVLAVGGNIAAVLYMPKKQVENVKRATAKRKRMHNY